ALDCSDPARVLEGGLAAHHFIVKAGTVHGRANNAYADFKRPGRAVRATGGDRRDAGRLELLASGYEFLVSLRDLDTLGREDVLIIEDAHHRYRIGHSIELAVGAAAGAAERRFGEVLELGNGLVNRVEIASLDEGLQLAIGLELGNVRSA